MTCCLIALASVVPTAVRAEPAPATGAWRPAATAKIGPDAASLSASSTAIVSGSAFGFSASVDLASPADLVQTRIRVWRPTGRLIFQRTRQSTDLDAGRTSTTFQRGTADLGLRPGIYPVEVEVSVRRNGTTRSAVLRSRLFVHEGDAAVPVVLVARVGGQPLSDSSGRFVADPAEFTRARDAVQDVSTWALARPEARVTLAVSPLLLEEWQRIASGYEFVGPEGVEQVPADSDVARDYASTLTALKAALNTGRIELAALGYADPDLSDLEQADLIDDIVPQYERGLSAVFTSLETTPSTGTVPAGGCVPAASGRQLSEASIRYAVVDGGCARSKNATAPSSAYRTANKGLIALVTDEEMSGAVASGDSSAAVGIAFRRLAEPKNAGPLIVAAELGAGGSDAKVLTDTFDVLAAETWVHPSLAREVAWAPKTRTVKLSAGEGTESDPAGYWGEVADARLWAKALAAATGGTSRESVTAQRDALIAESSAWAGADGSWALADRGLTFAATAQRLATDVLKKVTLAVEPVTLAGTTGSVPVTIDNASGLTLKLRLKLATDSTTSRSGVRVRSATDRKLELEPKETFVEVPVELANALSGQLAVSLTAGDVVLDSETVTVKASYLDRIALVVGVILALVALLAFIIRRVRDADQPHDETRSEAYTGQTDHDSDRRSS